MSLKRVQWKSSNHRADYDDDGGGGDEQSLKNTTIVVTKALKITLRLKVSTTREDIKRSKSGKNLITKP